VAEGTAGCQPVLNVRLVDSLQQVEWPQVKWHRFAIFPSSFSILSFAGLAGFIDTDIGRALGRKKGIGPKMANEIWQFTTVPTLVE
jgi:hypothetical protein